LPTGRPVRRFPAQRASRVIEHLLYLETLQADERDFASSQAG
jgi:hypothetical protein